MPEVTGVDENEEGNEEQYWLGNLLTVALLGTRLCSAGVSIDWEQVPEALMRGASKL